MIQITAKEVTRMGHKMIKQNQTEEPYKITRVIDFRLPIIWLIGGVSGLAFTLIGMWFSVDRLVGNVADLKIVVTSGNTSISTLTSEVSLLKFRASTIEDDNKRINELIRNIQQHK